ncbi:MAG: DHH family phosphoesterase [Anaerolineae bacterium]
MPSRPKGSSKKGNSSVPAAEGMPAPGPSSLAEIAGALQSAGRVLAICHTSPDGDAIGSLLGLAWVLRALPRPPTLALACGDPVPEQLAFLPGADEIVSTRPAGPWDAVVALDASDAERLGDPFTPTEYGAAPVIVLDHHVTNLCFGTLNYVDTQAAATAQIVLDLADALQAPISHPAAVCLLTGLVTDTLSFRTSNVTARTLRAAARLVEAGADISDIAQRSLFTRPLALLRLWGAALSRMQLVDGVLWTEVSRAMRDQAGLKGSNESGLSSQLINAAEARIAAVFSETADGQVEISLRARAGYDVATLALHLGGGGHPEAAGCTLKGTLAEVEAQVLPLLLTAAAGQVGGRP